MIPFAATLELPGHEKLLLKTKSPMILIGQLPQYPARGDLYRLQEPVDLVDPENPDVVVSRLTAFPAKRGGL